MTSEDLRARTLRAEMVAKWGPYSAQVVALDAFLAERRLLKKKIELATIELKIYDGIPEMDKVRAILEEPCS